MADLAKPPAPKKYDAFGGYDRLAKALAQINDHAVQVMTFDVALEHELDRVLGTIVRRPEALDRKMGFANKLKVFRAVWTGDEEVLEKSYKALHAFHEHRNRIAHGNKKDIVNTRKALMRAYQAIDASAGRNTTVAEMAQGIMAFIAGAPVPKELAVLFHGMEQLNEVMGKFAASYKDRRGGE
jgi:hypothetical protein